MKGIDVNLGANKVENEKKRMRKRKTRNLKHWLFKNIDFIYYSQKNPG